MKYAIIVGASSGIGEGLARLLVTNGYAIGITGRRVELLEKIKNEVTGKICIKPFDITDTESVPNHLEDLINALGGLDLFVISSGTGDENTNLDFDIEKRTIDTNIIGFTAVVNWAFNYFATQKSGHLVAITSIAGLRGNQHAPAYNATKAYQINYLEGLRQKAAKLNPEIFITDVRPGFVDTAMAKGDKLFWVSPVDKAARQILSSIKRKSSTVYITKRWRFIAVMLKLIPGWLYEKL